MKRVILFTILLALAVTLAIASEPFERHEQREVGAFLQLSTAQQAAWDAARADYRTATRALFEKRTEMGRQAEAALKEKSVDACAIGGLMIAIHAVSDQIKTENDAMRQRQLLTLTSDQKTRYDAFVAAQSHTREGGARD
jgi:hypothetical protein